MKKRKENGHWKTEPRLETMTLYSLYRDTGVVVDLVN